MEHLDEGTVHAWLDGALSPEEGDRVERHLAECADCSAVAAEARGLIAASTRILGALDDVPAVRDAGRSSVGGAGVGAGTREATRAVPARRRPSWPGGRYSAAAAIALIALGSAVVVKGRGGAGAGDFAAPAMAPVTESAAEAPALDSASRAPAATAPVARPPAAGDAVAGAAAGAAASPSRQPRDGGKGAARPLAARELKERDASAANEAVRRPAPAAPLPAPPIAPPRVAARALPDSAAMALESREDSALRKSALADAVRPGSDSTRAAATAQSLSPALRADEIAKRERERLRGEPRALRLESVVTTGTGAEMPRDRRVRELVACWALERTTAAREAGVPERVELLPRVVGDEKGRPVYAARALGEAGTDSTEWRWSIGERGELALLRGAGDDAARFPVAVTLASRTGETSVARRESCPSR